MPVVQIPIRQLDWFSPLVKTYLNKENRILPFIRSFYGGADTIEPRDFDPSKREILCNVLQKQYGSANHPLIDKLRSSNSFTITTGHQLQFAGGPMFFISKIASVISETKKLNKEQDKRFFIPVFWMASEDHDFAEISSVNVFGQPFSWIDTSAGPVGRIQTKAWIESTRELAKFLRARGVLNHWPELLERAYQSSNWSAATKALVNGIFGEENLVIIDADDSELKKLFAPVMIEECKNQSSYQRIQSTIKRFDEYQWPVQLQPREINLFYLGDDGRKRIVQEDAQWRVKDGAHQWQNLQALLDEINNHPENFSPNAALRPVYQECILPNVLYVGGPGELAYWLELKDVFKAFGIPYPMLALRDHFLWLTDAIEKKMQNLGLTASDLLRPKIEIEAQWMRSDMPFEIESYKSRLFQIFDELATNAGSVDSTLVATVGAEKQKALGGIDFIEKKVLKALKQKEEIRLKKLESIFSFVYPDGNFQDRTTNFFEMVHHFPDLVQLMINHGNLRDPSLIIIAQNSIYPDNAAK
jgi:bacillithiol biosynthesis cysteine-adding enzyme BshC